MKRIVIMGCSGSGKSTLARALGEALDLPVHHLDAYHWQPGWKEPDFEVFAAQTRELMLGDQWIIDGGYAGHDDDELRFKRADIAILFQQSVWLCLWRVIRRVFQYYGRTRPDMGPGCPEKVDLEFLLFIWNYRKKSWPKILDRVARNKTPVLILKQDPNIPDLVKELRRLSVSAQTSPANPSA